MTELRTFQPAFVAGVLSPALWVRVDLAKYQTGVKRALNMFIHPHGGMSNRAGLQFINEVKTSANNARLIPFQFNTEQSYILEFGDNYMRVYRDSGVVLSGMSPYELVTPYDHTDIGELTFIQEADIMYICHEDYPVQKLSRLADDNWTIAPVTFAPLIAAPTGLSGSARYKFRGGDGGDFKFRVTAVAAGGAESAGWATATAFWRYELFDGRFIQISWSPVVGAVLYRVYRTESSLAGIVAETTDTSADMPVGPGEFAGDGTTVPIASDPGAPSVPTGVSAEVIFGKDHTYVVSAVSEATSEESLPSAPFTLKNEMTIAGNKNTLTWDAVAGASAYIIYRKDNGVFGYIGRSEVTSFVDENITPDIADGPQEARNPFDAVGKYPRCATFIEQRLGFASTKDEPQGVWLSQSANYENFGVSSPAKASDAVTFRIKAKQVNEIRSMLATRGLLLLTSGAEWVVTGDANGAPITPGQIKIDNQGYRGSATTQPIVVGNTVLFPQERGGIIRDFSYEFAEDSFAGKDLTILARHLFEGRSIKSWAYAQAPNSIIWVILDNGSLVSLTYIKEHDVWGWTHHDSNGATFEDVAVIGEGVEDVPYFLLRRTIDGTQRRYIERLHTREFSNVEDAFFVDSGLTYTGVAATLISGLDHLEGEEVVALANGNVVRGLTVTAGAVTLPNAATKAHIGLPAKASIQTLDLDLGQVKGLGTVQGRQKSVAELLMRVEKTRGIWLGYKDGDRDDEWLVEYKQRETEAWNEAIQLYTGDILMTPHWDWNTGANVFINQYDPLPMTILAVGPDIQIGR